MASTKEVEFIKAALLDLLRPYHFYPDQVAELTSAVRASAIQRPDR